ncbi:MAG: GTP 3',8-cyclase MoaA [Halobacteriovoraceae bacterium]|jgi:GTP 3',8-cyclase|nr:GTP 3',8-cyclase MoaA [Halobacteriovoraceae bacterium]MBT5096055.1 GTP 3',8-cyclase MoaA [Halobacteriovoraceae bacterium]
MLIDPHGRHIHKLRVSLLDACNMKCLYCMPDGGPFMHKEKWVPQKELQQIVSNLVDLGIDEIRLTGGEPLLRPDFKDIISGLGELKLKKFGLTTNAVHLKDHLPMLKKYGCQHLNISLDSLNPRTHRMMTKDGSFNKILETILIAKEMGFNVKTNSVLMRGINHFEVENFLDFSADYQIEVRFLELMKIGVGKELSPKHFISAEEVISNISDLWQLEEVKTPVDSTSFNFLAKDKKDRRASVGFIASESRPFCGGCSRLRLGADGHLRPCLMIDHGPSLRGLTINELANTLEEVMALKPTDRIESIDQAMYQIGG